MAAETVKEDARKAFETVRDGGISIIALDVAYAIGSHSWDAINRIYEAKKRKPTKKNGALGSLDISREVHKLEAKHWDMMRAVTADNDLPMTVTAPVRFDHPFMAKLDPRVVEQSTKNGTLSLLINGGPLLNELATICLENEFAMIGSSANVSLQGSNFSLESIEPEVRSIADFETDYGISKYANPDGLSSSIIAFPDFEVIRFGVMYDEIREIFMRNFDVELPEKGDYVHIEQVESPASRTS